MKVYSSACGSAAVMKDEALGLAVNGFPEDQKSLWEKVRTADGQSGAFICGSTRNGASGD